MSCDTRFKEEASALGYSFEGELKIGGNYVPLIRDGRSVYVSGQIPRVGNEIVVTGAAGSQIDLARAQLAAKICAMRALALLQRSLGSLERVKAILSISVFVQSAQEFTQQSEVADGASDVLSTVLEDAGVHTRTFVGAFQLPKGAVVEVDFCFRVTR